MDKIKINKELMEQETKIGTGYESDVYLSNGMVYKIFNDNILKSTLKTQSKIKKLLFIHDNCKYKNICYPHALLYDENNAFIGYLMDYQKEKYNIVDFLNSNVDLKNKILLYSSIEKITLMLARNNIFVVDNNLRNYRVNVAGQIIVMDIDSVSTSEYRTECLPTYFFDYYNTRFNDKLDYNFVKYTLALQFLTIINKINRQSIRYYNLQDDKVIDQLIYVFKENNIDEVKDFFVNNDYNQSLGKILLKKY